MKTTGCFMIALLACSLEAAIAQTSAPSKVGAPVGIAPHPPMQRAQDLVECGRSHSGNRSRAWPSHAGELYHERECFHAQSRRGGGAIGVCLGA